VGSGDYCGSDVEGAGIFDVDFAAVAGFLFVDVGADDWASVQECGCGLFVD
jgi:hypothetical protein